MSDPRTGPRHEPDRIYERAADPAGVHGACPGTGKHAVTGTAEFSAGVHRGICPACGTCRPLGMDGSVSLHQGKD